MQLKHLIQASLISLAISHTAFAADVAPTGCYQFGVHVLNKTNMVCTLDTYQTIQGSLNSIVPSTHHLQPNETQYFQMKQSLSAGPTIVMTYTCGNSHITLESHQNFCFLEAGTLRSQVITADNDITGHASYATGSLYDKVAGNIYWVLENKSF